MFSPLFPLYYASSFFFFFNDGNIQTNTEKIKFVRNKVHMTLRPQSLLSEATTPIK